MGCRLFRISAPFTKPRNPKFEGRIPPDRVLQLDAPRSEWVDAPRKLLVGTAHLPWRGIPLQEGDLPACALWSRPYRARERRRPLMLIIKGPNADHACRDLHDSRRLLQDDLSDAAAVEIPLVYSAALVDRHLLRSAVSRLRLCARGQRRPSRALFCMGGAQHGK